MRPYDQFLTHEQLTARHLQIVNHVVEILNKKKWNWEILAKKMGIKPNTIRQAQGRGRFSIEMLIEIQEALNVPLFCIHAEQQ